MRRRHLVAEVECGCVGCRDQHVVEVSAMNGDHRLANFSAISSMRVRITSLVL
jgi:hypothetical protein